MHVLPIYYVLKIFKITITQSSLMVDQFYTPFLESACIKFSDHLIEKFKFGRGLNTNLNDDCSYYLNISNSFALSGPMGLKLRPEGS